MKRICALIILFLSAACIYAQSCPSGTVPIKGGGTCSSTAAGALENLGITELVLTPPAGFPWQNPPIAIFPNGTTSFDARTYRPSGKTYYANSTTGNDSNAGTLAAPFRTVYGCYSQTDAVVCSVAPGWYTEDGVIGPEGWSSVLHDIAIIASAPGVYVSRNICSPGENQVCSTHPMTWTNTSSYWSTPYTPSLSVFNPAGCVDTSTTNAYGDFEMMVQETSSSAVNSTANSWYWDSNVLYTHTFDSRHPDANVRCYANNSSTFAAGVPGAPNVNLYFENVNLVGGNSTLYYNAPTSAPGAIVSQLIFYGGSIRNGIIRNTDFGESITTILQNTTISGGCLNAILYNDSPQVGYPMNALEINVTAGNTQPVCLTSNLSESHASTAHGEANVIRIGGIYENTWGSLIADVNVNYSSGTTQNAWDVNTTAGPSFSTVAGTNSNYLLFSSGTSEWLYNVTSITAGGSSGSTDLEIEGAGPIMYLDGITPTPPSVYSGTPTPYTQTSAYVPTSVLSTPTSSWPSWLIPSTVNSVTGPTLSVQSTMTPIFQQLTALQYLLGPLQVTNLIASAAITSQITGPSSTPVHISGGAGAAYDLIITNAAQSTNFWKFDDSGNLSNQYGIVIPVGALGSLGTGYVLLGNSAPLLATGTTIGALSQTQYFSNNVAPALSVYGYSAASGANGNAGEIIFGDSPTYQASIWHTSAILSFDSAWDNAGAVTQFTMRTAGTPVIPLAILGSGEVQMPLLPGIAGSGGVYLCVDTTGNIYKKSTCP